MRPRKLDKKLSLNKQTISNVGIKKMNNLLGGAPSIRFICETWGGESCEFYCLSIDPPAICPNTEYQTFCPEC